MTVTPASFSPVLRVGDDALDRARRPRLRARDRGIEEVTTPRAEAPRVAAMIRLLAFMAILRSGAGGEA